MNFRINTSETKPVIRTEWYPRSLEDPLYLPCLMRFRDNLTQKELRTAAAGTAMATETVMGMVTATRVTAIVTAMLLKYGLIIRHQDVVCSDYQGLPFSLGQSSKELQLVRDLRSINLFKYANIEELLKYVEFKGIGDEL